MRILPGYRFSMTLPANNFSPLLLKWFDLHGRHDLPWQKNITPYRVWISEIMLQQTRVSTVIPYFNAFIKKFPDVQKLAKASLDEVLHQWTGLGYYARARNLHRTAILITENCGGNFPREYEKLIELPGIGRSTAGAILSIASGQRHPILDGNVKRVLSRYHAIKGWTGTPAVERKLWRLAEEHTPDKFADRYTQAIMDLGATICVRKQPLCYQCPIAADCKANLLSSQHIYPYPKPARKLPVKKTIFTILENHHGEILLEQRKPSGIWGGLWAFPECPPEINVSDWIREKLGYEVNTLEYQDQIRHTFSHYHLDIVPVHAKITDKESRINDSGNFCWYNSRYKKNIGLATPVKKLLSKFTMESRG